MNAASLRGRWSLVAFAALGLGSLLGFASRESTGLLADLTPVVAVVGSLWMDALRATVVPLVVAFVVKAVVSSGGGRLAGRMAGAAVLSFTLLLALGMAWAVGFGAWMAARFAPTDGAFAGADGIADPAAVPVPLPPSDLSFLEWARASLPTSVVDVMVGDHVVAVLLASVVLGFLILRLPERWRAPASAGSERIADGVMAVVTWVLFVLPLGVFGLAWEGAATLGVDLVRVLGVWIVGTSVLGGLFLVALHPLAAVLGRVSLRELVGALAPAQFVAVTGRSSLGSLPALVEGAIHRLNVPADRAGFVLPFSAAAFKIGGTMNAVFALFLLARVYGISLGPGVVVGFLLGLALLSYATPGIPSGGFASRLPLFAAVGIPLEGLVLLHAADHLPDMLKTANNATLAMVVLLISTRILGEPLPADPVPARPPVAANA